MARFYGKLSGDNSSTSPTRLGHGHLQLIARSWTGSINVSMYVTYNTIAPVGRQRKPREEAVDCVRISIAEGSTDGRGMELYNGPIAALLERDARTTLFRALAADIMSDGDSKIAA